RRLSRLYAALLGDDGILVSPVHPRTAPRHHAAILRPFDFLYTAVFNALRLPATSAPAGFDDHGLPLAVQFSSARGNDHLALAAATVMEEAAPPWRPAPAARWPAAAAARCWRPRDPTNEGGRIACSSGTSPRRRRNHRLSH